MGKDTRMRARGTIHYGWVVIAMGTLTTVGAHGFGRMAFTPILPHMIEGLRLTYTQSGLLGTGNFLGYLTSALIGGFFASKYGTRIVISCSLVIMGISMMLTGIVESFEFALLMRILTGLGNGGAYVPAMALGSAWFSRERRGLATGIVTSGIGLGTLVSGLVVPLILGVYGGEGWRFTWYWLGGAVLVIAGICASFIRSRPEDLGLAPVGSRSPGKKASSRGSTDSLDWRSIYRVKEVWHLGIVYLMYGFSYIIYMHFFSTYLEKEIGLTPMQAGILWAWAGGLSIFCGIIWGSISDFIGRRSGAALAYATLALSYSLFALCKSVTGFFLSAVVFGITAWSIPTIMAAAAGDYVGPRLAPAGLGFITLFFGIGQAIGPYVGGLFADVTDSFIISFILAACVSVFGALGSLTLRRAVEKPENGQNSLTKSAQINKVDE